MPRPINDKGIELLKSFEGCKLQAYQDIKGVWTVGYGHTGVDVHPNMEINQAMADSMLAKDLNRFELGICSSVDVDLNDNQFAALVCLSYNIGLANFEGSTLHKKLNLGLFEEAAQEFQRWDRSNGIEIPGLLRRRLAERDLFTS